VIYFQRVPEEKQIKNRLHLDLYVVDIETRARELEEVGGTRIGSEQTGSSGGSWQVMHDPVGNEFCLCQLS
jgi:predicted enzyme related to lactoylglutathione lyase